MRLTFLGTGTSQGVPIIACHCPVCTSDDVRDRRLRTSALLQTDEGKHILFDIGPDFRQQMLTNQTDHIDAILITHAHRDHVAGIDDIRPLNYFQHGPIDIYLNPEAAETLQRDYRYIFSPHLYPGLPEVNLHTVHSDFHAAGQHITPIHALHKDLPILGYRIGPLAYITDANHIPPQEMEKLQHLDTLVINALRIEPHWSHFNLEQALQVIRQLAPRQAYLTHISHELGLYSNIQNTLPDNVNLAYDNLQIST